MLKKNIQGLNPKSPALVRRVAMTSTQLGAEMRGETLRIWNPSDKLALKSLIYRLERNTECCFVAGPLWQSVRLSRWLSFSQRWKRRHRKVQKSWGRSFGLFFFLPPSLPPLISAVKPPTRSAVLWDPQAAAFKTGFATTYRTSLHEDKKTTPLVPFPKKLFNHDSSIM